MTCTPECRRTYGRQAHCSVCHLTFSGISTFDDHRKHGVCTAPQAMGLTENNKIWGNHGTMPSRVWRKHKENQ